MERLVDWTDGLVGKVLLEMEPYVVLGHEVPHRQFRTDDPLSWFRRIEPQAEGLHVGPLDLVVEELVLDIMVP